MSTHAPYSLVLSCFAGLSSLAVLCACEAGAKSEDRPQPARSAVRVQSAVVEERPVPKLLMVTGTLEAERRTQLAANATGRVTRTFVERGDRVEAGALLAQVDARSAKLTHAEAMATTRTMVSQLEAVRAECSRYQALRSSGAISSQQFDQQAVQCRTGASSAQAARARLAQAARLVSDSAIRAPFAGVIGERFVNPGDYVLPSTPVVTLLVDDRLRLRISVPEPAIPHAQAGATVTFTVLAHPDREYSAVIKHVGSELRPGTRDIVSEAIVENPEHLLRPGSFVPVKLPVGYTPRALVPSSARIEAEGGPTVFVIAGNHIEQRAIQAQPLGDMLAVSEGLQRGERVVVQPGLDLKDGTLVE